MRYDIPFPQPEQANLTEQENVVTTRENQEILLEGIAMFEGYVQEGQERVVKGIMAGALEDEYYLYRQRGKKATDLYADLQEVLLENALPSAIDRVDEIYELEGKRQPGFQESILATLERFHFMEQLEDTFGDKIESVIVGGSMSYGPFFNVRSGEDNSDIDAVMVMKDSFFDEDGWQNFLQSDIITDEDKILFRERSELYKQLYMDDKVDILSQRFAAKGADFNMSAHIMPRTIFEDIYSAQLADDMLLDCDTVHTLRDYKPKRFERAKCDHLGFGGETLDYSLPEQESAEGGYVATIPAYIIKDTKYYPGLYQCLLLPSTLIAYDQSGFASKVATQFAGRIDGRLEHERTANPGASLINAYPRKPILAPGRYES